MGPDLEREEQADFAAPPAHERSDGVAVIVGDFPVRSAAQRALRALSDAPGQRVAGHREAPAAVAPGAWVVLRPVDEGIAPEAALEAVRKAAPGLADHAFLGPSASRRDSRWDP